VGRVAYGMEIDALYCDAIVRRFEALTGLEATLEDGTPFANVAGDRLPVMGEAA
jgi:hypothetical protein